MARDPISSLDERATSARMGSRIACMAERMTRSFRGERREDAHVAFRRSRVGDALSELVEGRPDWASRPKWLLSFGQDELGMVMMSNCFRETERLERGEATVLRRPPHRVCTA